MSHPRLLLPAVLLLGGCLTLSACSQDSAQQGSSPAATPSAQAVSSGPVQPNIWLTTPATGSPVTGKGYGFKLPAGWADITQQIRSSQPEAGFDVAVQDATDSDGFASYFTVLSSGVADMVGRTGFADFLKEELEGSGATGVVVLPETSLDGSRTLRLRGEMTQGKLTWHTEQWVVSHGQDTYVITFAANQKTTDAKMAEIFGPVVSSWKWSA
ncbi:hypothetical protein [Luteococcus peritonei]|uniref:DUF1795 domain-containing protein n=1 Tax=Luteococcus peritonei TaxID=88874 RepID=A0ABW4RZ45_9ACTN